MFYRDISRSLWSDYIIKVEFHYVGEIVCVYVLLCEAQSACNARGSQGMPPRKDIYSEIVSRRILESVYLAI